MVVTAPLCASPRVPESDYGFEGYEAHPGPPSAFPDVEAGILGDGRGTGQASFAPETVPSPPISRSSRDVPRGRTAAPPCSCPEPEPSPGGTINYLQQNNLASLDGDSRRKEPPGERAAFRLQTQGRPLYALRTSTTPSSDSSGWALAACASASRSC